MVVSESPSGFMCNDAPKSPCATTKKCEASSEPGELALLALGQLTWAVSGMDSIIKGIGSAFGGSQSDEKSKSGKSKESPRPASARKQKSSKGSSPEGKAAANCGLQVMLPNQRPAISRVLLANAFLFVKCI